MTRTSARRSATAFVATFFFGMASFENITMQNANATPLATCADAPSRALADIGDALTTGSDANVLRAALANHSRLTACGLTRQAISAQLVAADAYGDVNEAKQRCDALRHAHNESLRIGDTSRAKLIERPLRSC